MKKILFIFTFLLYVGSLLSTSFLDQSKFSSGSWYKLCVMPTDDDINLSGAIYKIDYEFLRDEIKISPSSIDPRNIKIYGGKLGSALPQDFTSETVDDVEELAIYIEGEEDGSFDEDDYILFYASFASKWEYDLVDQSFTYELNPYTDSSFYYLTIDNTSEHNSLEEITNESSTATIVSVFDDHYHYEKETRFTISDGMCTGRNLLDIQIRSSATGSTTFPQVSNPTVDDAQLKYSLCQFQGDVVTPFTVLINSNQVGANNIPLADRRYYSVYESKEGELTFSTSLFNESSSNTVAFQNNGTNSNVYLDWYQLFVQRGLTIVDDYLPFRATDAIGQSSTFQLAGLGVNYFIWDITDPINAKNQAFSLVDQNFSVTSSSDDLREYIAFDKTQITREPIFISSIANQNLHALQPTDLVIITHPTFKTGAEELASYRSSAYGITTQVVDVQELYNEFSAGRQDPTAIRNFLKMLYDKDPTVLKYVLLFGDGSYDYRHAVKSNTFSSYIPAYQSRTWNNNVFTYQSDDYYSLLEEGEGEWLDSDRDYDLDLAVGRIPLRTTADMDTIIQKLKNYDDQSLSKGDWNVRSLIMADDGDHEIFVSGAEGTPSISMDTSSLNFITQKLYLDNFIQQATSTGNGIEVVGMTDAIHQAVEDGALFFSFLGHGSTSKLTSEEVTSPQDINENWNNEYKLPVIIIGSCSFGKFDHPSFTFTGSDAALFSKGGGIAIFSPTRFVFASANERMLDNLYESITENLAKDRYTTLGDIYKQAKNQTYVEQGYTYANRGFSFLGDPSMRLRVPKKVISIDSINGVSFDAEVNDTLRSFDLFTVKGKITDKGQLSSAFNGVVDVVVYDQPSTYQTIGHQGSGEEYNNVTDYKKRENAYFKGSYTVVDGEFSFDIVMPKYVFELDEGEVGKISLYAYNEDSSATASGAYTNIQYQFQTQSQCEFCDNQGPDITITIDNQNFNSGDVVSDVAPVFISLSDESGINTSPQSISRGITAEVRNLSDTTRVLITYDLRSYYQNDLNSDSTGKITGTYINQGLNKLTPGIYSLTVRAWDLWDNVGSQTVYFIIEDDVEVSALPNPFNPLDDNFQIEVIHEYLDVAHTVFVEILDQSGIIVATLEESFAGESGERDAIEWLGTNDFGAKVSPGVYSYRVKIITTEGQSLQASKRLVVAY